MATGDVLFEATGTLATADNLTANRSRYSLSLPLTTATGISVGDYLWLRSDATYEDNTSTKEGEIVRVRVKSGTTVTIRDQTHAAYNTADNARAQKITFVENITLRNVVAIGAGDATTAGGEDQYAARFLYCRGVRIEGCEFDLWDYAAVEFATCYGCHVSGSIFSRAYDASDGASYGIMVVHGSQHIHVSGCTFEDQRHGYTTGGTNAVNRYLTVDHCTMQGQRAGGLDTHPGAELVSFTDNIVSCAVGNLASGSQNGIQHLGGTATITGNTVRGAYEVGIAVQLFAKVVSQAIIANNIIERTDGTGSANIGIFVERRAAADAVSIVIAGNSVLTDINTGIQVDAEDGSIAYLSITGNTIRQAVSRGIYCLTQGSERIDYLTITGNALRVNSGGNECIYLAGAGAASIEFGTITGNVCYAGTYGVRGVNTDRIATVGNTAVAATTTPIAVAGANSTAASNVTA